MNDCKRRRLVKSDPALERERNLSSVYLTASTFLQVHSVYTLWLKITHSLKYTFNKHVICFSNYDVTHDAVLL